MLQYLILGLISFTLILSFILINKPVILYRIFQVVPKRDDNGVRKNLYMERFHEHKKSEVSRNLFVQVLPWLSVLGLLFILGKQYFVLATVLSGSMVPTFQTGDLVLMQTFDRDVKVGDIVMFPMYGFKEPITHRVINIKGDNFLTKGDANPYPDGYSPKERIAAKAVIIGNSPILLKGLGYSLRPEKIGPFKVLSKLPSSFLAAQVFDQFRAVQPLIIFFGTIFYFFILIETRMEDKRRFEKKFRNGDNIKTKKS